MMLSRLRFLRTRPLAQSALLLAASTVALVPQSYVTPVARSSQKSPDRFFASKADEESELERLRRENAELKAKQNQGWFGGLFKRREPSPAEKQQQALSKELDEVFKGTGIMGALVGSMAKGLFSMATSAFEGAAQDVDRVLKAAALELEKDLGPNVSCEAPMSQSYASSSVNGRVSKRLALVFRATASSGVSTIVSVDAQVDANGNVDILDLRLDQGRGSGPRKIVQRDNFRQGTVIDV